MNDRHANPAPRSDRHRYLAAALALGLLTVLTGCATPVKETPPTLARFAFKASDGLNPNLNGAPSPIGVRIYELRATGQLQQSDFFTLFDADQATLGADLVRREEMTFAPGESKTIDRELDPQTRFVGIMAAYRKIDQIQWRAVVNVTPEVLNPITVYLNDEQMTVARY